MIFKNNIILPILRFSIASILFFLCYVDFAYSKATKLPEAVTWENDLKPWLYEEAIIKDGSSFMTLSTPYRALDAAIMPISIKFHNPQTKKNFITSITIIVDENPSPVVGKFKTSLKSGHADLSTRIRIDKYTHVRAIAETNNGDYFMVVNYVKAAGGCSAPSLTDMDSMMSRLGKMKMKFIETGNKGQLNKAKLVISHPNFSGLQFNQLTRTEIPAHFVDKIEISQDNQTIMKVEADISMSEDPSIMFYYKNSGGPISVIISDTQGSIFKRKWNLNSILSQN
ncbi:MAG: quinoprotein dehydrogenase-associated SoxYZ-like carrier [Rickettsiales bacterium]|nr:quinoprotein dehydrogenase-associated SoxYZ-like carrier [Rickettsiales bacterium]